MIKFKEKQKPEVRKRRTGDAVTPPEAASQPGEKINKAQAAVDGMKPAAVHFLMKITPEMDGRLEVERARRGLRSRIATIMAILDGAMK